MCCPVAVLGLYVNVCGLLVTDIYTVGENTVDVFSLNVRGLVA